MSCCAARVQTSRAPLADRKKSAFALQPQLFKSAHTSEMRRCWLVQAEASLCSSTLYFTSFVPSCCLSRGPGCTPWTRSTVIPLQSPEPLWLLCQQLNAFAWALQDSGVWSLLAGGGKRLPDVLATKWQKRLCNYSDTEMIWEILSH